jgi:hypothetical protein
MSNQYQLDKWIWSDDDFEQLGFHDATIHAVAFGETQFELSLDIDYIFKWVHPAPGEEFFRFWVAPCTLVFENVYEVRVEAEPYGGPMLSVDELRREDPRTPRNAEHIGKDREWRWTFECHHGDLTFWAVGFRQYVRRPPILQSSQALGLQERGGYSFDRVTSA